MKTLVVGLGNPILGDGGVGWKVAEELKRSLPEGARVEVDCLSLGGMGLMEHLIGYDHVILVDAFEMDAPVGSISVLKLSQLPNYSGFHVASAQDPSLQDAIEMGRDMGACLPQDVMVVGIAADPLMRLGEGLSPPMVRVVPCVVNIVLDLLKEMSLENGRVGHPSNDLRTR
jgi:hydrogenase maturation protease